ncbi:MAG TPA: HAMP domain-containing sensor histidine kinase [Candidatus Woesebacteria bacterium]|nr:HAMP domain-containing sensor histidine kinase [Candidatus Woesebacteria bacterium]
MNSLFTLARIKLTFWYVSIVVVLTASISTLFYLRTSQVISTEYERINRRIEREWIGMSPPPGAGMGRHITIEDLSEAKQQIIWQLLGINVFVVTFFSIVSYWLTGKTLKPIQQSHEAQKQFVGDAAHELKTPITALKTSLEVNLLDRTLSKETKQILKENLTDVIQLESLSHQLLNLARIEDRAIELQEIPFQPILSEVLKTVSGLAKKKQISLVVKQPKQLLRVKVNKGMLKEAILTLLDNAIKYSPSKSQVTIELTSSKSMVLLSVQDQGPGIAKTDLPHVFKRFYRVDQSRNKQVANGYGLGLSIAQSIITQHHGKITVNSTVGKGSTFTIQLPLI